MKQCGINQSVTKKDHYSKMRGEADYIADLTFLDMLYSTIIRSTCPHGRVVAIHYPILPHGYFIVDAKDVPGNILLKVVTSEQPIFATEFVRFIGEPMAMICGPNKEVLETLKNKVKVEYDPLSPVFTIEEATDTAAEYSYEKGDVDKIFEEADEIIEETFRTGYQEQAYLEPQGIVGCFKEGKTIIYGSMQCPYYVKNAVMQAMAFGEEQVQIIQTTTGGGFGGKEDYPSLIAAQVAVAAKKVGKPVQLILNRREDMGTTPKRHPSKIRYQIAIKDKKITGLKANILLDAGAYAGLSSVVLQRALIAATGVYHFEHLKISGTAMLTNQVPNGAYRGFGAPQSFFALETMMNHVAKKLKIQPLELKKAYLVKQGDTTSTNGKFHHHVPLEEMLAKILVDSDYEKKHLEYEQQPLKRTRKGIGMSIFLHGCGFTGSAEKDLIRSKIKLVKQKDDKVEILVSNTDIGQGLKTTLSKIVAEILPISLEDVIIVNPDTDRVPNSGPTVASRSLMIVGKLLERASLKMKEEWESKKEIIIEENYQQPFMIPWDAATFQGDAYPTYSYGINVIEVETDLLTGCSHLTGVWGSYDCGKVIDDLVMLGQAEGGMLQGIGYASMEHMENEKGRIRQSSFTDYMIPTAMDTLPFSIRFVENLYEDGPFGAKGAGELTLIGAAPAYVEAVEQSVGKDLHAIPVTPESLLEVETND